MFIVGAECAVGYGDMGVVTQSSPICPRIEGSFPAFWPILLLGPRTASPPNKTSAARYSRRIEDLSEGLRLYGRPLRD